MRRTYGVPFGRAGLMGLVVALVLLCLPGTSIASGASDTTSSSTTGSSLLQYGAGYDQADGTGSVRTVQRALRGLGWQPGPVDGLYGPWTTAAVARFQSATGLAADGIVGPATQNALTRAQDEPLRRGAGYAQPNGSPQVRAVQVKLTARGLRPGPVDGLYGPLTQAAVTRLQRSSGVPANGVVTTRTRQLLTANGGQTEQRASTKADDEQQGQTDEQQANADTGGASSESDGTKADDQTPAASTSIAGDEVNGSSSDDVALPLAILIGALALAAGLLAGALLGRRNRVVSGTAVPLAQGVRIEGTHRSFGRFAGTVHALVLGRRGLRRAPEASYLVTDQGIDEPFWVSQEEVSNIVPPARVPVQRRNGAELEPVRAVGYVTAPEGEPFHGAQFNEQSGAIDSYCEQRGWELTEVVRDVEGSSSNGLERQGLLYVLDKIGRGEANCIVVSDLGRLSGSAADLGGILDRLDRSEGRLVAMDIGLDTASGEGQLAARALASVGSWEQDRSRPGLAAAQAATPVAAAPTAVQDVAAVKGRIVAMRQEGMTLQAIADVLNSEGVPTLRGGAKWRPSSVQSAAGYRRPQKRQEE